MVKKFSVNGARIKELRDNSLTALPQKALAGKCGISERQLRRIESNDCPVEQSLLQRIATALGVGIGDIAYGAHGPTLIEGTNASLLRSDSKAAEPEMIVIPRHTTSHLGPVSSAQALYDLARDSMEIIPHLLVDAPVAQTTMIMECLTLLKSTSDRQWSCGAPVVEDDYDKTDFPEVSRRARLAELFVLIKGNDIRILAEREIYHYPIGRQPWLDGQKFCFQLVVGFAPPRGEYEEDYVVVPFDAGREAVLPSRPIF